ncbi:MAG: ABC transporter ATP-binding protein/permease [Acholeplasmataceae bacterium]|nr:ABC transporter ATP-binding protein/permease [Acholeplasmataceae bacterium]
MMIKVNHLNKSFGKNNRIKVIKDLTIDFPEKGLVVLLGHSGSGKTTFLNILGGLESADDGKIEMFQKNIKLSSERAWGNIRSKDIGYIFQNYHLIPTLTVYENVAMSLRILGYQDEKEIQKRVFYTLDAVGMLNFRGRLSTQLSGGQQQRVAIARAIVKNPKVILADEPTGNLDSKNTYEVMNIIQKIAEDKLVILVSHEKHLVKHYADRIIEVKDGIVISDYINEKTNYTFVDDNTIYLKDLNDDAKIKEEKWNIELFSDDDEPKVPYKVTMIVRNKTLYLDVSGSIKNYKILNQDRTIQLNKEQLSSDVKMNHKGSDFDLSILSHDESRKRSRSFLSIRKAIKNSFVSLFNLSKKAKMMFFVFALMGFVIAVGIPFLMNVKSERVMYVSDQQNLINVKYIASTGANYRLLQAVKEAGDDTFYINIFKKSPILFDTPNLQGENTIYINSDLGIHNHLSSNHLMFGRLPENKYEIAIDYSLILEDYTQGISQLKAAGVWDYEMIIGRNIVNLYLPERPFIVTAVVNTGAKRVYAAKEAMAFLGSNDDRKILPYEMFVDDSDFIYTGRLPRAYDSNLGRYEVMIPKELLYFYTDLETWDFESGEPYQVDYQVYVSGYYEYVGEKNFFQTVLLPSEDFSLRLFQYTTNQRNLSIVSRNPERTMIAIEALFSTAQIDWPYQNAANEGKVFLLGLQSFIILGILLVILSIACVYFMLKASMTSKIYEISVYRALGVKKYDIIKQYVAEILVTMTFSSLTFFLISTLIIKETQNLLIGSANYFLVSTEGVLIGVLLIYSIGLVGLIPISRLLSKSPAQILSQYDI